jgi:predicted nucleotidyltransferase component of viral defense system
LIGPDADPTLQEVQAALRLPSVGLVEKDFHVVRAIGAIAALDATPFMLVFGGGTALARAHRLVRRMSEDVDFKVVPGPDAPSSRNALRQHLGVLRDRVTEALLVASFSFDPSDTGARRSRNENRYTVFHLPYNDRDTGQGLRPTIQIELTFASLRLPSVTLPVSSFVQEAFARAADAAEFHNQFPAYAAEIAGETVRAVEALRNAPVYRDRYAAFMLNMVYGDRPDFETAMATVAGLAVVTWGSDPA